MRTEEPTASPSECVSDTNSRACDNRQGGSVTDEGSDSEGSRDVGGRGACSGGGHYGAVTIDPKGLFDGGVAVEESARVFDGVGRRLADLEIDICPRYVRERGTGEDGQSPSGRGAHDEPKRPERQTSSTVPTPQGVGGEFARLVVVKELQPVPEHAPEEARHLLELALDHNQVKMVEPTCPSIHGLKGERVLDGTFHHEKVQTCFAGLYR